jgi:Fe-S cluster assembly protein SufD
VAQQLLRYGLVTPLKAFTIPDAWDGVEAIATSGIKEGSAHVQQQNAFLGTQHNGTTQSFRIPASTRGEVTIDRVITGSVARHCTITVEAGANVTIIEHVQGTGTLALATSVIVEPGASATYRILQDLSATSTALLSYEARVTNSTLHWLVCTLGSAQCQASVRTNAAENAVVTSDTVCVGTGTQQFDMHAATEHTGPGSRSDIRSRSVLDEHARMIQHGLIRINPGSHDCDSYQKAHALILSETASAQAIPNLEILDHRVRCSHGATIGRLDAEKIFYLTSRGIDPLRAKRMVTEGFLAELVPDAWLGRIQQKLGFTDTEEETE